MTQAPSVIAFLGQIHFGTGPVPDRASSLFGAGDFNGPLALKSAVVKHGPAGSIAWTGEPQLGDRRLDIGELPDVLLSAWHAEGTGMLARLQGPFALAIADPARRRGRFRGAQRCAAG